MAARSLPTLVDRRGETDILSGMEDVAIEALSLADGADIHNVAGLMAVYRTMIRERLDATNLERELRSYVGRMREERLCLCAAR